MKRAIAYFVRNPVAANLLMAVLVVGGLVTLPSIRQLVFPDVHIDAITVGVPYPGATPEEVEKGVCVPVEEAIEGVEGVDRIRSTAVEGACAVVAELVVGADVRRALDEIRNRVDALDTLPEEAEDPVVSQLVVRRPVVDVAVYGRVSETELKEAARRVRDEIARLPGISQVELRAVRPYEISIEIPEAMLRRYGITLEDVASAVRRHSLDLPAGSLKTRAGEILVRTQGKAYRRPAFERIPVVTRPDGSVVTVGDLGTVVDGFEDVDLLTRFDGQPAAMVRVFRVGEEDAIEIADRVRRHVEQASGRLAAGVHAAVWRDRSRVLRERRDTLLRNGASGFVLVLAIVGLFLRPRVAFWVTLGVPIAFLGALFALPAFGITINVVSLFAFILVLGILVDDAIVVGENVHRLEAGGMPRLQAAVQGTHEVAVPVIFGVLTTVAAFVPLLLVPGPMGQIFSVIGTVVILCLLFSLTESQLVLPAHLAHRHSPLATVPARGRWVRFQARVAGGLERLATGGYRRLLERVLEWRYVALGVVLMLFLWAVGILASGRMRFSFFPPVEANYVAADLTLPQGTPAAAARARLARLESAAEAVRKELRREEGRPVIRHVFASMGAQPFRSDQSQSVPGGGREGGEGAHVAEVVLELARAQERDVSAREVARRWRARVGTIPEAVELTFSSDIFSAGAAVAVDLHGPDLDELRAAAALLKERLARFDGVFDIADSFRAGKQEVKLSLAPEARPLGITLQALARQVRAAFYGAEAQRLQRDRDEVKVMVRYPPDERRSLADLERLRLRLPDGRSIPFESVAHAEVGRGFSTIRRIDGERVVSVTADVDRARTSADEVIAELQQRILPRLAARYPGIHWSFEGERREQRRAFAGLARSFLIALAAIYALLAIPLRSYGQPLLIMSAIPFGIVGAVVGHLIHGKSLSFLSVIGMVAAAGVVVNASLVMVDYVNRCRREGVALHEAIRTAGVARFRPIVLTSLTTYAGLTPLMLERSVQAQFLIPMALSLAYGVVVSALVTLFAIPAAYAVLEDVHAWRRRWIARLWPRGAAQGAAPGGEAAPVWGPAGGGSAARPRDANPQPSP